MPPVIALASLFVYGTLMPGRLRWPFLAEFAVGHRPASAPGRIYDSGQGWPVAVFTDAAAHANIIGDVIGDVIPGVLVELDPGRVHAAMPILDDIEGTATDALRRIRIVTTDGDAAWAYHHPGSVDGLIRVDRWHDQPDR